MTLDECQQVLSLIRQRQGTAHPLVRIRHGEAVLMGRIRRSDSDPEFRDHRQHRYGVLVVEPTLSPSDQGRLNLQIADLACDAIQGLGDAA